MRPWTEADVMAAKARMKGKGGCVGPLMECPPAPPLPPKPSKYHAVLTECDGIKFQSKKEAAYYRELMCRVQAGEVQYFLRQVPFHLKGKTRTGRPIKYVVDFMECMKDGTVRYVDVKGFKNQVYLLKRGMVEASYPVRIEEV